MSAIAMDFPTFLVFALAFVLVYRYVKPLLLGGGSSRGPRAVEEKQVKPYALPESVAEADERVVGQIGALWLYPVKSAPGIEVDSAVLGPRGFVGDRELMLVRECGENEDPAEPLSFQSLRNLPSLAQLRVRLEADGTVVVSSARGGAGDELRVPPAAQSDTAATVRCRLWDDVLDCSPVSPAADTWCSAALGRAVRLVRIGAPFVRDVPADVRDPAVNAATSLSDGFPYLAAFTASLTAVAERAGQPVDVRRFRPNLVVRGGEPPFAEDSYAELRVGRAAVFRNLKVCIDSRLFLSNVLRSAAADARFRGSRLRAAWRAPTDSRRGL
jgi:uncharacterized protein YcbX